jgi:hypothetical protein
MSDWLASDQQNRQKIDDWLLALLRFAITRDTVDQTAAVEIARPLDAGKVAATRCGTFFVRTTAEVYQAIDWANNRSRISILRRHLARIENPRFAVPFGLRSTLRRPMPRGRRRR